MDMDGWMQMVDEDSEKESKREVLVGWDYKRQDYGRKSTIIKVQQISKKVRAKKVEDRVVPSKFKKRATESKA
jgi:hypothetical protein